MTIRELCLPEAGLGSIMAAVVRFKNYEMISDVVRT